MSYNETPAIRQFDLISASCRHLNYHRCAGKTLYKAAHTNNTVTAITYECIIVSLIYSGSNCVPQLFGSETVLSRLQWSYPSGKCSTVYNVRSSSKVKWPVQLFPSLLRGEGSCAGTWAANRRNTQQPSTPLYENAPLTFRHRASCILGQAFHYSPENVFYIFNQQIYFIILYLLDRASLI